MTSTERSRRFREQEAARIETLKALVEELLPDAEHRLNHLEFLAGYRRSARDRAIFDAEAQAYRAKIERARAALEA